MTDVSLQRFRELRFPDETKESLPNCKLHKMPGVYRVPGTYRWRVKLDIYDDAINEQLNPGKQNQPFSAIVANAIGQVQ